MLTLSVMVLVFLVGYCAGGWRMLAKFEKELGAHVAALEDLRESVGRHASWMLHEHPEPEGPMPPMRRDRWHVPDGGWGPAPARL